MRKILLFVFLAACLVDATEEKIITQLETVNGIRHDLRTKILELEKLAPITAKDSLDIVASKLDSLEAVVYKNIDLAHALKLYVDTADFRAEIVPAWIDQKVTEYRANQDSVLLNPYRVQIRQTIDGVKREFEQIIYLN